MTISSCSVRDQLRVTHSWAQEIAHAHLSLTATSGRFPTGLCQNFTREANGPDGRMQEAVNLGLAFPLSRPVLGCVCGRRRENDDDGILFQM